MSAPSSLVSAPVDLPARGEPGWRLPHHSDDPLRGAGPESSSTSPLLALALVVGAALVILAASWVLGGSLETSAPGSGDGPDSSAASAGPSTRRQASGPGGEDAYAVLVELPGSGILRYAMTCPAGSTGGRLVVTDGGAVLVEDAGPALRGALPLDAGAHPLDVRATCPWDLLATSP